jgi:hypothetical protein
MRGSPAAQTLVSELTIRVIFALLLTVPVVACGSSENVTRAGASPPTVTYNVDDTKHLDEANDKAAAFCSRYDRPARLDSLDQQNGRYVATYVCR